MLLRLAFAILLTGCFGRMNSYLTHHTPELEAACLYEPLPLRNLHTPSPEDEASLRKAMADPNGQLGLQVAWNAAELAESEAACSLTVDLRLDVYRPAGKRTSDAFVEAHIFDRRTGEAVMASWGHARPGMLPVQRGTLIRKALDRALRCWPKANAPPEWRPGYGCGRLVRKAPNWIDGRAE